MVVSHGERKMRKKDGWSTLTPEQRKSQMEAFRQLSQINPHHPLTFKKSASLDPSIHDLCLFDPDPEGEK